MDSIFDLGAGVDLADIVSKLVFLTVPFLALAKGLERFRKPGPAAGPGKGKVKAAMQRLWSAIASFATIVAVAVAGLGLVPLARLLYQLISEMHPTAPAILGVIVLTVLVRKGFVMLKDLLLDGKVDRPLLWLIPAPLIAMLFWVGAATFQQIGDQAGDSVQMFVHDAGADE